MATTMENSVTGCIAEIKFNSCTWTPWDTCECEGRIKTILSAEECEGGAIEIGTWHDWQ